LVHLFLSDIYLPAIPAIRAYMIGDALRVSASIAMFTAFARGRPGRYAAIEIATLMLMGAITLLLIAAGDPRAPFIGYCGAYATTAAIVVAAFLARMRVNRSPSGHPAVAASIAARVWRRCNTSSRQRAAAALQSPAAASRVASSWNAQASPNGTTRPTP
jgi:O-antigen/teichoic acid export membrane protein